MHIQNTIGVRKPKHITWEYSKTSYELLLTSTISPCTATKIQVSDAGVSRMWALNLYWQVVSVTIPINLYEHMYQAETSIQLRS